MEGIFSRSELLLGEETMKKMASTRVLVVGVGGVGSWCVESLVRTGITHITIVDSDRVCASNVNRQLMATTRTIDRIKVDAMKEHLLDINPEAEIIAINDVYSNENNSRFHLEEYDYIIDCIDSLQDKISLLVNATALARPKVFSSMGAARKLDPTRIATAEFWKVRGCPLGSAMRKMMRKDHLTLGKKVRCVYSEELLENKYKATDRANGSLMHITAIFGLTIAGMVIEDLMNQEETKTTIE